MPDAVHAEPTEDASRSASTTERPTEPVLSERGFRFIQVPGRYAVVSTVDADGAPHQARIWYRLDGTTIVINSALGRRWPTNLERDPRVSLMVAHDYDWVSATGTVEAIHDQAIAQADIAAMARAYDPPADAERSIKRFQGQHRITFRIHPIRFHEEFED